MMTMNLKNDKRGFTLIEVIAVLVVLAVLLTIVASRVSSTSYFTLISETAIFKMNFRYAQIKAMTSPAGTNWGINIGNNVTSYTLVPGGNMFPYDGSATHTLSNGITMTGPANITFTNYGGAGAANQTVTMTDGTDTTTLTVIRNTGYLRQP